MTSPDPSVISDLEAPGITEAELDAMVNVSLERMNDLAHFAAIYRACFVPDHGLVGLFLERGADRVGER